MSEIPVARWCPGCGRRGPCDCRVKGGDHLRLSEHFNADEFRCKCRSKGLDLDDSWCHGEVWVHPELINRLEELRSKLGRPIIVSSGCRCPRYNQYVGGASMSQHKRGTAADIIVKGVTPLEVAKLAVAVGFSGVKNYAGFTHVDVREGAPWHELSA